MATWTEQDVQEAWEQLSKGKSSLQVARLLARTLRQRSPAGISTWSMEQVRQHFWPVLCRRNPALWNREQPATAHGRAPW